MIDLKKVSLIEFAHHSEVLLSYVLVLMQKPDIEVNIYCTQWIYDQCYVLHQYNQLKWNIKNANQAANRFLNTHLEKLNVSQLIVITSHEDSTNSILNVSKIKPTKILVCHKINTFFRPYRSIKSSSSFYDSILFKLKLFKFYLKRNSVKNLLREIDFIAVDNERLLEVYNSLKLLKPCLVFPFGVRSFKSKNLQNEPLKIIVPGSVSEKSRDYDILLEALKLLKTKRLLEVELLGKVDKETIIKKIKSFSKFNIRITYHTSFINQKVFDAKMLSSDFLVLPIQKNMSYGPIKEDSGYTTISGNINDIIRYGLPAIAPDYYPLSSSLKKIVETYTDTQGLSQKIDEWIASKKYQLLKNKMDNSLVKHEASYLLQQFIEQLSNKIS